MTKTTKAQRIRELEGLVDHWNNLYVKELHNRKEQLSNLDYQIKSTQSELNEWQSRIWEIKNLWNQWTLINKGDDTDPSATVRLPREALGQLLILLKP